MKTKLFFLMVVLMIPVYVSADTINITCPNDVIVDKEFSCDVTASTTSGVTDIDFDIQLSNLSFVTFVKENGWNGEGSSTNISLYGSNTFTGSFKIGVLKLKSGSSGNGNIVLGNVLFYNNRDSANVTNASKSINIKSNTPSSSPSSQKPSSSSLKPSSSSQKPASSSNKPSSSSSSIKDNNIDDDKIDYTKGSFLSGLKIEGYEINFRPDIFAYDLKIGNESKLNITPSVSSKDVTYEIHGNENLKDGSIIYIEVRYKNDSTQTYDINISKEERKNFAPIFIAIIVVLILFNAIRLLANRGKKNEQ